MVSHPKPLTRHQMTLAIDAVEQVKEFVQDSGMDTDGARAASLDVAISSLEMVRKHWTPSTRTRQGSGE